jgi:hypothetical protein
MIERTDLKSVEGIARRKLARAALLCGALDEAAGEIRHAGEIFAYLPPSPAVRLYSFDGEIGLLEVEAQSGHMEHALAGLRAMKSRMSAYAGQVVALRFYQTLAETEHQAGNIPESNEALDTAIRTAESGLASIAGGNDRLAWNGWTAAA